MVTPQQILVEDEDYDSAADEDFSPDAPAKAEDESETSSDDETSGRTKSTTKRRRKDEQEELDFQNSGDEATLARGRKKRRKADKAGIDADDEGGEGGLIKTRAQRKAEGQEKRPLVQSDASSVDVDALWAQMSAGSTKSVTPKHDSEITAGSVSGHQSKEGLHAVQEETSSHPTVEPGQPGVENGAAPTITIKRTYEFAGQKTEEMKTVLATSAEARLYLEQQAREKVIPPVTAERPGVRRPKKKASMFDASPSIIGSTSSHLAASKAPKLNTVQKSKQDWAAHVDKEGISEELDEHGRAKEGYLDRMSFLDRMEAKRKEEMQNKPSG